VAGETVTQYGVAIVGPRNLPSTVPVHASQMYSKNVLSVIKHVFKDGKLQLDPQDEIVQAACLTAIPAAAQ
jgi:NAD(P) transhydrogenase subunit alpha